MALKKMSFGKLMAIFGGFFVLMLVVAVLVMKNVNKSAPSVVTKTYTPTAKQAAPVQPNSQIQEAARAQEAAQAQAQTQAQAALQPSQNAISSNDTRSAASADASAAASASQAPLSPPPQPDITQRLESIDSRLASIQTRLAAVEGKRAVSGETSSNAAPTRPAKRVRRTRISFKASTASLKPAEERPPVSNPPEVKALAVVGNRAWVRGADGIEESVTTGDTMPTPRPRVRSVDAVSGVVIMTSDAN